MSEGVILIGALTITTVLLRSSGPLLLGHRDLPTWSKPVITVLPGALITGLVVVQTLGPSEVSVDERILGVGAAAAVLWWRREAMFPAIIAAALTVALVRLLA